jgi:hypothetical protein
MHINNPAGFRIINAMQITFIILIEKISFLQCWFAGPTQSPGEATSRMLIGFEAHETFPEIRPTDMKALH